MERNREEWNLKIRDSEPFWPTVRAAGSICSELKKGTKRHFAAEDLFFSFFFLNSPWSRHTSPGIIGVTCADRYLWRHQREQPRVSSSNVPPTISIRLLPILSGNFVLGIPRFPREIRLACHRSTRTLISREAVASFIELRTFATFRLRGTDKVAPSLTARAKRKKMREREREQRRTCSRSPVHSGTPESA